MNEKFFALTQEKQNLIINAAYKVFATNEYNKAPTSEIAAEAGISKALLFHYFHNKFELYSYLWEKAKDVTAKAEEEEKIYETEDFFEMLRRGLKAKIMLMRAYPYMSLFSINAFYETEPDIKKLIDSSMKTAMNDAYQYIQERMKTEVLRTDMDFEDIYTEILYASEGMMNRWYREEQSDIDRFEAEYLRMISIWEKLFCDFTES